MAHPPVTGLTDGLLNGRTQGQGHYIARVRDQRACEVGMYTKKTQERVDEEGPLDRGGQSWIKGETGFRLCTVYAVAGYTPPSRRICSVTAHQNGECA